MAKDKSATTGPAKAPKTAAAKTAATKPAAPRKASTVKATAAKSSAPKPAPAKAAAKAAAKPRTRAAKPKAIPPEQRRNYIEVAAYYIAARRDFAPGDPLQDWIQAEAEIDGLLAKGLLGG